MVKRLRWLILSYTALFLVTTYYQISKIYGLSAIFDKKIKFEALQDYFYDTLVKIHVSGAALWKNDFLDAVILCNLQNDHVLITFDNGVIERMEKRKSEYPKYQESINVINMLKQ